MSQRSVQIDSRKSPTVWENSVLKYYTILGVIGTSFYPDDGLCEAVIMIYSMKASKDIRKSKDND